MMKFSFPFIVHRSDFIVSRFLSIVSRIGTTMHTPNSQLETLRARLLRPCRNPDQLHRWVQLFTGLNIPRTSICAGHAAPFDYLVRAYFEPSSDQIVWAPRGGGKTRLAALATPLGLLHKTRRSG